MSLDVFNARTGSEFNTTHNHKPFAVALGVEFLWDGFPDRRDVSFRDGAERVARALQSLSDGAERKRVSALVTNPWSSVDQFERFLVWFLTESVLNPDDRVVFSR